MFFIKAPIQHGKALRLVIALKMLKSRCALHTTFPNETIRLVISVEVFFSASLWSRYCSRKTQTHCVGCAQWFFFAAVSSSLVSCLEPLMPINNLFRVAAAKLRFQLMSLRLSNYSSMRRHLRPIWITFRHCSRVKFEAAWGQRWLKARDPLNGGLPARSGAYTVIIFWATKRCVCQFSRRHFAVDLSFEVTTRSTAALNYQCLQHYLWEVVKMDLKSRSQQKNVSISGCWVR